MDDGRLAQTLDAVVRTVCIADRAAVFSSFGKDSMVLLGLLREAGLLHRVRVITFRHADFPERYTFADDVIRDWSIDALVCHHAWNFVIAGHDRVDLLGTIRIRDVLIHMPVANMQFAEETTNWSCALDNEMDCDRDLAQMDYDLILIGSKQGDIDPVVGHVRVPKMHERSASGTTLLFPLREWSDTDVWDFLHCRAIPFDHDRYRRTRDGEMFDETALPLHPEYLPVCTACINPADRGSVWCAKWRQEIPSRAGEVVERQYPLSPSRNAVETVAF